MEHMATCGTVHEEARMIEANYLEMQHLLIEWVQLGEARGKGKEIQLDCRRCTEEVPHNEVAA